MMTGGGARSSSGDKPWAKKGSVASSGDKPWAKKGKERPSLKEAMAERRRQAKGKGAASDDSGVDVVVGGDRQEEKEVRGERLRRERQEEKEVRGERLRRRRQRSREQKQKRQAVEAAKAAEAEAAKGGGLVLQGEGCAKLRQQWAEIEFLLRVPLRCDGDVDAVEDCTVQSIAFMATVRNISSQQQQSATVVSNSSQQQQWQ
jgi:hypothetical protein